MATLGIPQTAMDPIKALDMAHRSGISQNEVDDFADRMDLIAKAMEDVKNGTFDPLKCNIPGYKTPEQEKLEQQERRKREQEKRKQDEECKRQQHQEEHDNWWYKAELRYSIRDAEEEEEQEETNRSERWANRLLAAYKTRDANDYSLWDQWVPEDPVTLQEKAEREAELEKLRNREFENNNTDFCDQFKKDMDERKRSQEEKTRSSEGLKQKGNNFYKKKQYEDAIKSYMDALSDSPFNVAVLANIAQCYLRLDRLDDCIEFSTRTLYVDEKHVKALSRRATALHRQGKLKEAADDMQKAFELDGDNADIAEQHSIIVGDFEDSITSRTLEVALEAKGKHDTTTEHSHNGLRFDSSSIEELRFSVELFKKMDEQISTDTSKVKGLEDAWVAYELLLPFMKKNEHVRAKFRTSGEMDKLCERILTALGSLESANAGGSQHQEAQDVITSAMIDCATAAVVDTSRNQVVMFRNTEFRKGILTAFGYLRRTSIITKLSWIIQASIVRLLEELVDSKCWRSEMLSEEIISSLFTSLCLHIDEEKMSSTEKEAKKMIISAASSICFTLSSDSSVIQVFNGYGVNCLAAVAQAVEVNRSTSSLAPLLGFLTNLSTSSTIRKTIESKPCEESRRKLIQTLLLTVQDTYTKGQSASESLEDFQCIERALGVLLNFSFTENSQVRTHDLLEFGAIETIERIFKQTNPSNFTKSILILSRTASLLCRLHSSTYQGGNDVKRTVLSRLTSSKILSMLYNICEYANASICGKASAIPDEMWQLCAQIWCHFGWCIHISSVREFLREKNAVPLLIQVIALANCQKVYNRFTTESTACERLVGNIVKVMITMQSEQDPTDKMALRKKGNLSVLVQTLQELSDGLARKNVAILLAKMCQSDSQVKDTVRELRGIEMMLSVSRSIKSRPAALSH